MCEKCVERFSQIFMWLAVIAAVVVMVIAGLVLYASSAHAAPVMKHRPLEFRDCPAGTRLTISHNFETHGQWYGFCIR